MAAGTVLPIIAVFAYIIIQGGGAISWNFLTGFPHDGMRQGGIMPAIVGTFYLTLGTAVFSVPLGVAAAIYLSEYASENWLTRIIRIAIINLSGIPSVVYGLFGLGLFVLFLKFGTSILSASLTLSIMTLPVIISDRRRGPARRATILPHGLDLPGSHPLADHPPDRTTRGLARHHHGRDPRPGTGRRRNRPDPFYRRRVFPAAAAAFRLSMRRWPCPITCSSSRPRCPKCPSRSSTERRWY